MSKLDEAIAKFAEIAPLSAAKATASGDLAVAKQEYDDASQALSVAQVQEAAAESAFADADAAFDAKLEEIKALLTAAQAE